MDGIGKVVDHLDDMVRQSSTLSPVLAQSFNLEQKTKVISVKTHKIHNTASGAAMLINCLP